MASRRLEVVISGNANDAVRALGQTERAVGQFDRSSSRAGSRFSQSWRRGIGEVGRAVTGLVAGAGLVRFFQGSLSEAQQAQQVMRQTAAVIQSTGGVAGVTAGHLADLSGQLSQVAAVDDEVIQQGGNLLLTFRNVRAEGGIFDDALASALDMSAALGTELQPNIMAVGRALMAFAEAEACRRGYREVRLYTHQTMTENIAMYPRLGYQETGRGIEDGYARVFFAKPLGRP